VTNIPIRFYRTLRNTGRGEQKIPNEPMSFSANLKKDKYLTIDPYGKRTHRSTVGNEPVRAAMCVASLSG
jgi:hypothetical protein